MPNDSHVLGVSVMDDSINDLVYSVRKPHPAVSGLATGRIMRGECTYQILCPKVSIIEVSHSIRCALPLTHSTHTSWLVRGKAAPLNQTNPSFHLFSSACRLL